MSENNFNLVVVGHVDHGKSTLVGRLLADLQALPEGRLEQIKNYCDSNAKPFEYAFVLDALKEERRQGITIDVSRIFFRSKNRRFMILDAPGHEAFIKNMVTGAAHAHAAILLIDATEGIQVNTQRHIQMLGHLSINQVVVVVNKMDLIGYDEKRFRNIKKEICSQLRKLNLTVVEVIPASAYLGLNLSSKSSKDSSSPLLWYKGQCLIDLLESLPQPKEVSGEDLKLSIQDVYKFTEKGDSRRLIAATLHSGTLRVGERIQFYPSNQVGTVDTIETYPPKALTEMVAPAPACFTLKEDLFVRRGEIGIKHGQGGIVVGHRIKVRFFWIGKQNLSIGEEFTFKTGFQKTVGRIVKINSILASQTLESRIESPSIEPLDSGELILELDQELAFEENKPESLMNRFVLIKDHQIMGGGIVLGQEPEEQKIKSKGLSLLFNRDQVQKNISEPEKSVWCFKPNEIETMKKLESDFKRSYWKVVALDFTKEPVSRESQAILVSTLQEMGYTVLILSHTEFN